MKLTYPRGGKIPAGRILLQNYGQRIRHSRTGPEIEVFGGAKVDMRSQKNVCATLILNKTKYFALW